MSNAAQVTNEMRMFALKKWATTELYVRQFSNDSEDRMRSLAPGPDTGTLDNSIKAKELSLGVFNLNPKYTFDTFIVGKNNELAYAAARGVAEFPGEKFNPLFIIFSQIKIFPL